MDVNKLWTPAGCFFLSSQPDEWTIDRFEELASDFGSIPAEDCNGLYLADTPVGKATVAYDGCSHNLPMRQDSHIAQIMAVINEELTNPRCAPQRVHKRWALADALPFFVHMASLESDDAGVLKELAESVMIIVMG